MNENGNGNAGPAMKGGGTPGTEPVRAPRYGDGNLPLRDGQGFTEGGADSADLALATVWLHSQLPRSMTGGRQASGTLVQAVLFHAYAAALAQRRMRLTSERPRMWRYGPAFPAAFAAVTQRQEPGAARAAARRVEEADPAVYGLLGRLVRTLSERRPADTQKDLTAARSPWGRCHARSGDRWGEPLDDTETAAWYARKLERGRT